MDYCFGSLEEAIFINRDNRFRAEILIDNKIFKAHVPNSGRMKELLVKGARVWVQAAKDLDRKTPYDLVLVEKDREKVCLNAHLANGLFEVWLQKKILPPFIKAIKWQREKALDNSRIDFFLETKESNWFVEIKSVNLVIDSKGMFPDAPTKRGVKHLNDLVNYIDTGQKAAVVFIILRGDVTYFTPNYLMDPSFANSLRRAKDRGVEIYAYKTIVSEKGIDFGGEIPVYIEIPREDFLR